MSYLVFHANFPTQFHCLFLQVYPCWNYSFFIQCSSRFFYFSFSCSWFFSIYFTNRFFTFTINIHIASLSVFITNRFQYILQIYYRDFSTFSLAYSFRVSAYTFTFHSTVSTCLYLLQFSLFYFPFSARCICFLLFQFILCSLVIWFLWIFSSFSSVVWNPLIHWT